MHETEKLNKMNVAFWTTLALAAGLILAANPAFAGTLPDDLKNPFETLKGWMTAASGILVVIGVVAVMWTFVSESHGGVVKPVVRILGAGGAAIGAGTLITSLFGTPGMLF